MWLLLKKYFEYHELNNEKLKYKSRFFFQCQCGTSQHKHDDYLVSVCGECLYNLSPRCQEVFKFGNLENSNVLTLVCFKCVNFALICDPFRTFKLPKFVLRSGNFFRFVFEIKNIIDYLCSNLLIDSIFNFTILTKRIEIKLGKRHHYHIVKDEKSIVNWIF